jgi:hypothetical protein
VRACAGSRACACERGVWHRRQACHVGIRHLALASGAPSPTKKSMARPAAFLHGGDTTASGYAWESAGADGGPGSGVRPSRTAAPPRKGPGRRGGAAVSGAQGGGGARPGARRHLVVFMGMLEMRTVTFLRRTTASAMKAKSRACVPLREVIATSRPSRNASNLCGVVRCARGCVVNGGPGLHEASSGQPGRWGDRGRYVRRRVTGCALWASSTRGPARA